MTYRRDRFQASLDKCSAVEKADAAGQIADGMDYRKALMARVRDGEITLEQAQADLAKTKRNAKKQGKQTRAQVWRQS